MKFRIKYADRIVGLFVLLAAVALVAGIILLGANQRWFSRDYHFTTRLNSAAGAAPGTPIYMKGFQVGKMQRLRLTAQNEVDADFLIFDTYYPKVRENSILELVTSPIGLGTQLLFHPGKSSTILKEGSFIPMADSEEGKDLIDQELVDIPPKDDTISRLLGDVSPLLENLNKTVVTVNRTLTELNRAIAGQSSTPLANIVTQASQAMTEIDAIAGNLKATTDALRDPTGLVPKLLDAKGSVKDFLDDKGVLFDSVTSSLTALQGTLKDVQAMTSSLNAQMPSIAVTLEEGRVAIQQAQDVLEGLKNNPLLKGGIPQRSEQQSTYQSMREGEF